MTFVVFSLSTLWWQGSCVCQTSIILGTSGSAMTVCRLARCATLVRSSKSVLNPSATRGRRKRVYRSASC